MAESGVFREYREDALTQIREATQDDARWAEFSAPVRAFVRKRVPPGLDADDVVQDVFLRIVRHRDELDRVENLEAWIFRVARTALADALRAHQRRDGRGSDVDPDELAGEHAEDAPRAIAELAPCLRPFVSRLDAPYRQALELTDLGGMSQTEAATQLGISVSGMKSRVQRARDQVRRDFLDCCAVQHDARGAIMDVEPRTATSCTPAASIHQIQRLQK